MARTGLNTKINVVIRMMKLNLKPLFFIVDPDHFIICLQTFPNSQIFNSNLADCITHILKSTYKTCSNKSLGLHDYFGWR